MRARDFYKALVGSKGVSMTEALIGVGLITTLAFLVARFSTQSTSTSNRPVQARTCEAIAVGVIDAVKRRGPYNEIHTFTPDGGARSINPAAFSHEPVIADADLWNAIDGANEFNTNTAILNSYASPGDGQKEESRAGWALIDGYMRSLAAIYNSNAGPGGYCDTWTNYNRFTVANLNLQTDLLEDTNADGRGDAAPSIEIQIRPYDIDDGTLIAPCPAVVRPLPPGRSNESAYIDIVGPALPLGNLGMDAETFNTPASDYGFPGNHNFSAANRGSATAPAARESRFLTFPPGGRQDLGFQLHVKVNYSQGGLDTACESSQNFQYYEDTTAPPPPTITITANNSVQSVAPTYTVTNATNRSLSLRVQHAGDRGIQLFCRDRSERLQYRSHPNPSAGGNRSTACYHGGVWASDANPNFDTNWTGGLPLDGGRQAIGATITQDWVPCDQVRVCGVSPVSTNLVSATSANIDLTMNYNNISPNNACDVIVDVVAIDPAGNRSDINSLVRTQFSFADANTASVIRRPRCMHHSLAGTPSLFQYGFGKGVRTSYGWWCAPGNTGQAGSWTLPPIDWTAPNRFPNGYYTTSPTGCCVDPADQTVGTCRPQ